MNEYSRCQRCNADLSGQAVGELCASCLLKMALEPLREEAHPFSMAEDDESSSAGGDSTASSEDRCFGDYQLLEMIGRGG